MPLSIAFQAGLPPHQPATATPMDAARQFALALQRGGLLERTWRLKCELRGRAAGGMHRAVMLGLEGLEAGHLDAPATARLLRRIQERREVRLLGRRRIAFDTRHHMTHVPGAAAAPASCGLRLCAFDPAGQLLMDESFQVPLAAAA